MNNALKWRRTAFERLGGNIDVTEDDWYYREAEGRSLARIYQIKHSPNAGHWFWTVLIGPDGHPAGSCGSGHAETGRKAREMCEDLVRAALGNREQD
jgi:hypothetical protein